MSLIPTLLVSLLASLSTYELAKTKYFDNIRASCISTIAFYFAAHSLESLFAIQFIALTPVFFGASFIGMSSHSRFSRQDILLACLVFSYLYMELFPSIQIIGGALGLSAFLSVVTTKLYTLSISKITYLNKSPLQENKLEIDSSKEDSTK